MSVIEDPLLEIADDGGLRGRLHIAAFPCASWLFQMEARILGGDVRTIQAHPDENIPPGCGKIARGYKKSEATALGQSYQSFRAGLSVL